MKIEDAIIARIEQLKIEKGLSQYKLSEKKWRSANHFGFYKTKKKYQCRSVNNS